RTAARQQHQRLLSDPHRRPHRPRTAGETGGAMRIPVSKSLSSSSFFPSSPSSLAGFSSRPGRNRDEAAFTLIEIAISLAIIAFALVAIIGVLPIGLNVQRDNREETIINHDATMIMDAMRSGARGFDDLTNYVIAITNYWE